MWNEYNKEPHQADSERDATFNVYESLASFVHSAQHKHKFHSSHLNDM
jgi:hypothetical protein